jgi:hypothetical protein
MSAQMFGDGLLTRLLESLMNRCPSATGAAVGLVDGQQIDIRASVGAANTWNAIQLRQGSGPLLDAIARDQAVVSDPFEAPDLRDVLGDPAPQALVVVPNSFLQGGEMVTTVYFGAGLTPEDIQAIGDYEPVLAYALGFVEYCAEAEDRASGLVTMVQNRMAIEQAKGMLMVRRDIDSDDAFALLVDHSQRHNVKVRAISAALVGMLGSPTAEMTEEIDDEAMLAAKELWAQPDR